MLQNFNICNVIYFWRIFWLLFDRNDDPKEGKFLEYFSPMKLSFLKAEFFQFSFWNWFWSTALVSWSIIWSIFRGWIRRGNMRTKNFYGPDLGSIQVWMFSSFLIFVYKSLVIINAYVYIWDCCLFKLIIMDTRKRNVLVYPASRWSINLACTIVYLNKVV